MKWLINKIERKLRELEKGEKEAEEVKENEKK